MTRTPTPSPLASAEPWELVAAGYTLAHQPGALRVLARGLESSPRIQPRLLVQLVVPDSDAVFQLSEIEVY
jgi:hypothetical protein